MNQKLSTLGFDKIYVINLKKRSDRKKRLKKEVDQVRLTLNVEEEMRTKTWLLSGLLL